MNTPQILDCTIRDGGYNNEWRFDDRLVRDVYRMVSKSGVDYVELGFHGTEKYFAPDAFGKWRFSRESDLRAVVNGTRGARIALMVDFGKFDVDALPPKRDSVVDLIRIAVHRTGVPVAAADAERLKDKGYEVSLQLMGYSTYSGEQRRELRAILAGTRLDYLYVADSYGALFPYHVQSCLASLREIEGPKIGFHPHNNLQMALANAVEAMRHGVDIIDGTLYGMGRGAGNLPLELLVAHLQGEHPDRFNVLPLLNLIDRYFVDLQASDPWGYRLHYMLSGILDVHPNYAGELIELREYTIEDIWQALQVVKQRSPVGFSKDVLNDLIVTGLIGTGATPEADLEPSAAIESHSVEIEPPAYVNRHRGRDFLILANGPTLSQYQDRIRLFIDQYDPVILGANYLGDLFVPHYHAFNNKRRLADYAISVDAGSRLLIGSNIDESFVREYTPREFEQLAFHNRLDVDFDIVDGIISANCRTIAVLLVGVAHVMGAERIFIAGMDGYTGGDRPMHFYDEKDEANQKVLIEKHRACYRYLDQINAYLDSKGLEGLHILTPTGYARFYTGITNYLPGPLVGTARA